MHATPPNAHVGANEDINENENAADRIVYGVGTSRALRVHWALLELGLAYETRPIQSRSGETQSPAYTALDPRQKIPVLKDGDFIMTESAAIVTYLGDRYGRPADLEGLVAAAGTKANPAIDTATANNETTSNEPAGYHAPSDWAARARYNEWMSFITMELDATALYVLRRHEGLPEVYGAAPAACSAARGYFAKMIEAAARRHEAETAAHHCHYAGKTAASRPEANTADRQREAEAAYLLGPAFTGVDIVLTTVLSWALRLDLAVPPVLRAYHDRITQRPAYQAALVANTAP